MWFEWVLLPLIIILTVAGHFVKDSAQSIFTNIREVICSHLVEEVENNFISVVNHRRVKYNAAGVAVRGVTVSLNAVIGFIIDEIVDFGADVVIIVVSIIDVVNFLITKVESAIRLIIVVDIIITDREHPKPIHREFHNFKFTQDKRKWLEDCMVEEAAKLVVVTFQVNLPERGIYFENCCPTSTTTAI